MQGLRLGLFAVAAALAAPAAAEFRDDPAFASEQERRAYTARLRDCELKALRWMEDRTGSERQAKEWLDMKRRIAEETKTLVCR